jgi:hypothetical protein
MPGLKILDSALAGAVFAALVGVSGVAIAQPTPGNRLPAMEQKTRGDNQPNINQELQLQGDQAQHPPAGAKPRLHVQGKSNPTEHMPQQR